VTTTIGRLRGIIAGPLLDHVTGRRLQFTIAALLGELQVMRPVAACAMHGRYGLGCEVVSDMLLRRGAAMTAEEIWQLESEALEMLGFALVTEAF
jgi:hypothetical protein